MTNDSESGLVYYEHDLTEKMQMKSLRTHFVLDYLKILVSDSYSYKITVYLLISLSVEDNVC